MLIQLSQVANNSNRNKNNNENSENHKFSEKMNFFVEIHALVYYLVKL